MKNAIVVAAALSSVLLASGAPPLHAAAPQSVADGFPADLLAPPVTLEGTESLSNGRLATGDVNEDGLPDLVGFDDALNRMVLFLNEGGVGPAGFAPAVLIQMQTAPLQYPEPRLLDLNGDGHLDLLGVIPQTGVASVRLGDGTGAFGPMLVSGGGINSGHTFDVADIDGDGALDIVLTDGIPFFLGGKIMIQYGNGGGLFFSALPLLPARHPNQVLARDVNDDGIVDVVFLDQLDLADAVVVTHLGLGGGEFASGVAVALPTQSLASPFGLASADANGDGALDLYVAFPLAGVQLLAGGGDGTFTLGPSVPFPQLNYGMLDVADMDRDGVPDVIVGTFSQVLAQRMSRSGPVGAPAPTPPFPGMNDLIPEDFDQDGLPDIARCGDTLQVLTNTLGPVIDIGYGGTSPVGSPELVIVFHPTLDVVTIGVTGLPQLYSGLVFFGFEAQYTPFSGGVLVPSPVVQMITVTGVGFTTGWPSSIPTGTAIYAQAVMFQGAGLTGPVPSNALVLIAE